ncbi:hypothetical protein, partial [Lutimonas sp.]|uniref:hypothetical protein n=1 Tax=Lutimonas sp. TaxID=1872403 RepID=UPI003D9B65F3
FFVMLVLITSFFSCAEEGKDKNLLMDETYLEKYDGSTWKAFEEDMRIYIKINDDMNQTLDIWMSDLELEKLMVSDECFEFRSEVLNNEDVTILENSETQLKFTHLKNDTYTFSMDGKRMKLEYKTSNKLKNPIYFTKTTDDVSELVICDEESEKNIFDWEFLKH